MIEDLKVETTEKIVDELEFIKKCVDDARKRYNHYIDKTTSQERFLKSLEKKIENYTTELKSREYPKLVQSTGSGSIYLLTATDMGTLLGITSKCLLGIYKVGHFENNWGIIGATDYKGELVLTNETLDKLIQ